jgi:acyl-homoserine-lactone acylase
MHFHRVFPAIVLGAILTACSHHDSDTSPSTPAPPPRFNADITRTTHGVVHVKAADFRSLGYGLAYAYAQDNLCMFADSLLTVRGERSLYFGGEARATAHKDDEYGAASAFMDLKNEDSDFFFKGYLDVDQLRAGYAAGAKEPRDLLEGYVAGYNRYLKDNAGNYPAACKDAKWDKPMTVEDKNRVLAEKALHASGEVFAKEVVAGARDATAMVAVATKSPRRKLDPAFLLARLDKVVHQGFGSNALAVGKDLSASGRGLLLGNPHFPWTSTDRFYQAHLTVPGRYDAMGVVLGGLPVVVIGFNKDVAWSHTVTAATHFTTFKLALDAGDSTGTTYLIDGEKKKMTSKTVSVDILMADGTTAKRTKTFYFSKQGAVIVKPEAGLTWSSTTAYVLADPNRGNTRMLEQWLGIGTATSVQTLKSSLDTVVGLPWVNTVAADRAGNALYADASVVPRVTTDKFAGNCLLLPALVLFDGSRSACGWGQDANAPAGIFSPANAPSMLRTDYVGNSNDSYWLTNARSLLTGPAPLGYSPLYGKTGVEQRLHGPNRMASPCEPRQPGRRPVPRILDRGLADPQHVEGAAGPGRPRPHAQWCRARRAARDVRRAEDGGADLAIAEHPARREAGRLPGRDAQRRAHALAWRRGRRRRFVQLAADEYWPHGHRLQQRLLGHELCADGDVRRCRPGRPGDARLWPVDGPEVAVLRGPVAAVFAQGMAGAAGHGGQHQCGSEPQNHDAGRIKVTLETAAPDPAPRPSLSWSS